MKRIIWWRFIITFISMVLAYVFLEWLYDLLVHNSINISDVMRAGGFSALFLFGMQTNPLKPMQSAIALCCRLIRVLFALAKQQVPYDPVKVLGPVHMERLQNAA